MPPVTVSRVLVLMAMVAFILSYFGVQVGPGPLWQAGLAFFAAAGLVP